MALGWEIGYHTFNPESASVCVAVGGPLPSRKAAGGNAMQIPGSNKELNCIYLLKEKFHLNSYFRFCDLNDDGNQYVMFWTVLYDPEAKV